MDCSDGKVLFASDIGLCDDGCCECCGRPPHPRKFMLGLGARGVWVSLSGLAVGAFGLGHVVGMEKPFGAPPAVVVDIA
jgi:hypothetical protein